MAELDAIKKMRIEQLWLWRAAVDPWPRKVVSGERLHSGFIHLSGARLGGEDLKPLVSEVLTHPNDGLYYLSRRYAKGTQRIWNPAGSCGAHWRGPLVLENSKRGKASRIARFPEICYHR
jgi:hypothetical protein